MSPLHRHLTPYVTVHQCVYVFVCGQMGTWSQGKWMGCLSTSLPIRIHIHEIIDFSSSPRTSASDTLGQSHRIRGGVQRFGRHLLRQKAVAVKEVLHHEGQRGVDEETSKEEAGRPQRRTLHSRIQKFTHRNWKAARWSFTDLGDYEIALPT